MTKIWIWILAALLWGVALALFGGKALGVATGVENRESYSQMFVVAPDALWSVWGRILKPEGPPIVRHAVLAEIVPVFPVPIPIVTAKGAEGANGEVERYIREVFGSDANDAVKIATCESGLNPAAFNPEIVAKRLGITKYSSCGLLQNNDPRCDDPNSELYDYRYSVDLAYQKFLARRWKPWTNCAKKHALPLDWSRG